MTTTSRNVNFGSIKTAGNGEVYAEVYIDGMYFGEAWGLNGTQEGEEAYFPSIEEFYTQNSEAIEAFEAHQYARTCPHCGEEYFSADDKYRNENPNSCDMWQSQEWESHIERCEEYQKINDPFWHVKNSPEAQQKRLDRGQNKGLRYAPLFIQIRRTMRQKGNAVKELHVRKRGQGRR